LTTEIPGKTLAANPSRSGGLKSRFGPLKPTTLNEEIYEAICSALRDGRLMPGESISVRDLAAAVNTSPMPVREALRRLEAQGVLVVKPGKALSVPGLVREDIHEIYTIRMELEGLAAALSVDAALPDDDQVIQSAFDAMQECYVNRDYRGFMETNYLFHMAIYRIARMPRLLSLIEPLWLRISPFLWTLVEDKHLRFAMEQHKLVLAAFKARDRDAIRQAIVDDIHEAKRKLEGLAD